MPLVLSDFHTLVIGVKALWIGIAALSLTFLAGYGGMVSLAQTAMYGVAGLTMANLYARHGFTDWTAVAVGIARRRRRRPDRRRGREPAARASTS